MNIKEYLNQTQENIDSENIKLFDCAKDYQKVIQSDSGQRMIEDLKEKFEHESCFYPGVEYSSAAYYEGQRSIINYIKHQLNYKPNLK